MGYLDNAGLGHLWETIKTALAGKQDTFTPGDGLSMEDGALNADNPVRGVYTQAEWDALTEAQRASGTYFVDDGASCAGWEEYSTEETRIGTWIDGKPLYQIVCTGHLAANAEENVVLRSYPSEYDVVIYESYVHTYDQWSELRPGCFCIPNLISGEKDTNFLFLKVSKIDHTLVQYAGTDWANPAAKYIFVLKYTKTTDAEVSA